MDLITRQRWIVYLDDVRRENERRISVLCVVIGELLPPNTKTDRAVVISNLARIVFRVEQDLMTDGHVPNPRSVWHHNFKEHTKVMGQLATRLKEVADLLRYAGIVEELEHPDIAWDILDALYKKAERGSKRPRPLKQGNVQTPVGVYVCAAWKALNSAGIRGMRKASRIVADLLIATVPKYNTHDRNTLAKSCYQIIRERNNIS